MSRSYKKNTFCSDYSPLNKWGKRIANKSVRRHKDYLANGNSYRKVYDSWNIHDWKIYESENYARKWFHLNKHNFKKHKADLTEQQYIDRYWKKYFKRK